MTGIFNYNYNKIIDFLHILYRPPFATGTPHYGHILAGTIKVINSFL